MSNTLVLTRHGKIDKVNVTDNTPLNTCGHEFAKWFANNLRGTRSDIVVYENVVRCFQTIEPFREANECAVKMHDSSTLFKHERVWVDKPEFTKRFLKAFDEALTSSERVILCYRHDSLDCIKSILGEEAFETLNVPTDDLYSNIYTFICEGDTWRHQHTQSHPYGKKV